MHRNTINAKIYFLYLLYDTIQELQSNPLQNDIIYNKREK